MNRQEEALTASVQARALNSVPEAEPTEPVQQVEGELSAEEQRQQKVESVRREAAHRKAQIQEVAVASLPTVQHLGCGCSARARAGPQHVT